MADTPDQAPDEPDNAFTRLMSSAATPSRPMQTFKNRMALGAYMAPHASHPNIIYQNADFTAIRDLYPKATVHALLLPHSPSHTLLSPLEAFDDPPFLAAVRAEVAKLKTLVAEELRGKLGGLGRDWEGEVRCGVHVVPSMAHLHVHVFSRDMRSACVKHRKHYNSFNTPFLVAMDELPLNREDGRRRRGVGGELLRRELRCWRCGRGFGNRFKELKEHLELEFQEWRRQP